MAELESRTEVPAGPSSVSPSGDASSFGVFGRRRAIALALSLVVIGGLGIYAMAGMRAKSNQESGANHRQKAEAAIHEREFLLARDHLNRCLEFWPFNGELHFLMARTCRRAGDRASWSFHLFVAERLQWPKEQIELEHQLYEAQTGNVWSTEETLENYLQDEHADYELVFEALAEGYFVNNSSPDLQRLTSQWLRLFPDAWLPHIYRGHAYSLESSQNQAVAEYRRALELNPEHEPARIWLASALMDTGQFQEALQLFEVALQNNPGNFRALYGLASCQLSLGDAPAARKMLQQLLAVSQNNVQAFLLQAKVELAEGEPERALHWLRQAERLAPREPDINHLILLVLRQLNRNQEAEKYGRRQQEIIELNERLKKLRMQFRKDSNNAALRMHIGHMYLLLGHQEEAQEWLQSALRLDPSLSEAQRELHELNKKREAALEAAEEAKPGK
jgi:tetratricopeptide (TPR) repeat protein